MNDLPGKLYPLKCDVTKEEDILRAFRWISENIGVVHILINNAGVTRPTNLIGERNNTNMSFSIKICFY